MNIERRKDGNERKYKAGADGVQGKVTENGNLWLKTKQNRTTGARYTREETRVKKRARNRRVYCITEGGTLKTIANGRLKHWERAMLEETRAE